MNEESEEELIKRIEEIRSRIPPHSVPPRMLEQLEEMEEKLEELRRGSDGLA